MNSDCYLYNESCSLVSGVLEDDDPGVFLIFKVSLIGHPVTRELVIILNFALKYFPVLQVILSKCWFEDNKVTEYTVVQLIEG